MSLPYLQYDVFTDEPLRGNQLAVFTDARSLSTERMQLIAREMNFSESTFILPAERAATDVRMRIFTPYIEMPMAGHPTIGSTFALAHTGAIPEGATRFVFGLNIGPIRVDLEWKNGELRFAWMTQAPPVFGLPVEDRAVVAAAVGLTAGDLIDGFPIQQVSCGIPYLVIPLRDRATVDRAISDSAAFAKLSPSRDDPALFLFAIEPPGSNATIYTRMFAPGFGVSEDPATGSAGGPVGCYLVKHGLVSGAAAERMLSLQGVAMGRASRIHISIRGTADNIQEVRVGGEAVLVARGELLV